MAWKDKAAKVAYKHAWYMANRARLGRKDRPPRQTPEQKREWKRQWYLRNQKRIRAAATARYTSDPEYAADVKAKAHSYYEAHKEDAIKKSAARQRANPEMIRAFRSAWKKRNPHQGTADSAHRRSCGRNATPSWADRAAIKEKYAVAARETKRSGIKHVVDHFYPLRHKLFSGLHVPWNLRVIIDPANAMKSNTVTPNMLAPRVPAQFHGC